MTEPMTLEEAVRLYRDEPNMDEFTWQHVRRVLFQHAERTVAARSGEPLGVREIRVRAVRQPPTVKFSALRETVEYIDTLTAELAAANASYQEVATIYAELDEKYGIAIAELAAAREERDAYKRAKAENDDRFMGERDDARADRDRLAACVERVRGVVSHTWSGFPGNVRAADILAALEGTNAAA
jgi:hypothetical protein